MTETDAEKAYVKLQHEQDRTDQPTTYPSLKTLEHDLGAVYEPDPRFPLDGSGGAWCFPDGSKLHLRAGRLYC